MILQGDCVEKMRELDEASVDAIVCDPPYGLGFMGKEWDDLDRGPVEAGWSGRGRNMKAERNPDASTPGGRSTTRTAFKQPNPRCGRCNRAINGRDTPKGFKVCHCDEPVRIPQPNRDAQRSQQWHQAWATEALRVLKPGGHLLAFGGTRTYHRLACAVEDAGFEIRDSVIWLYGSGFPKSHNLNGDWQGWGTALKPSHEPIVVARKPLVGTVAANVLEHGTGALNVDGCRINTTPRSTHARGNVKGNGGEIGPVGLSDGYESESAAGRWPSNVVLSHLPECEQVGVRKVKSGEANPNEDGKLGWMGVGGKSHPGYGTETIPAYECAPGCPVSALDAQSGEREGCKPHWIQGTKDYEGWGSITRAGKMAGFEDTGGASRFFYTAKASRAERNAGLGGFDPGKAGSYEFRQDGSLDGNPTAAAANVHPTVKPIDLMRWLVRLATPPGGTVLDPFVGSGTTGVAAALEGFDFIGIEREAEYVAIAEARIAWWSQFPGEDTAEVLIRAGLSERLERDHRESGQLGLLDG